MPVVLGHEGAGIVQRVGERVTKVKPGDHVVLTGDSCGACPTCLGGDPAYCDLMSQLNFTDGRAGEPGSFNRGNVAIHGHFFGQSSFCKLRRHARAQHDSRAQGRASGNSRCARLRRADRRGRDHEFAASARGQHGRDIWRRPGGLERRDGRGRLRLLGDHRRGSCWNRGSQWRLQLGATHTVLGGPQASVAEKIRGIVPGGVGYAFDTTGRADSNHQALESLAAKGHFGFCAIPAEAPKMSKVMLRGLSIRGIVQGDSVPDTFIPHLVELHMNGRFPFDKLVTKYPFEKINQAIDDQAAGKVVKPVFTFSW